MAEAPPYMQIVKHFRSRIADGFLAPGDHLPPVRKIAETWMVARATADKALAQLQDQGLVHASGRGGTVVSSRVVEAPEGVSMKATRYTVSAIPEDDVNARHYAIQVVYVPPVYCVGGWRVEHHRNLLDRGGEWDGDWVEDRDVYFDLPTALRLALDAAPKMTCGSRTVQDVLQDRIGK